MDAVAAIDPGVRSTVCSCSPSQPCCSDAPLWSLVAAPAEVLDEVTVGCSSVASFFCGGGKGQGEGLGGIGALKRVLVQAWEASLG